MSSSRANVISSFTIIKGSLINETYAVSAAGILTFLKPRTFIESAKKILLAHAARIGHAISPGC